MSRSIGRCRCEETGGKEQILQALKRLMRMAQELEEQLLNIQRQKYRRIRLQKKQLSAILYTPALRMAPSFYLCVLRGNSVCKRLLVHVKQEAGISLCPSGCADTQCVRDPVTPHFYKARQITGRLHQLHV